MPVTLEEKMPSLWLGGELRSWERVFKSYPKATYGKGSIIHLQDAPGNFLYFLHEGIVKICLFRDDGSEKILGYHLPGGLFALDCLVGDSCGAVTSVAVTDVVASPIRHVELKRLMKNNPELGVAVSAYYCKVLRLMCFQMRIQCRDILSRIANFLLMYYRSTDTGQGLTLIRLGVEDLAAITGASRVHVSRGLKRLRQEGIIRTSRCKIAILAPDRLLEFCSS